MFDSMVDESESMDQCSKTFGPPQGMPPYSLDSIGSEMGIGVRRG